MGLRIIIVGAGIAGLVAAVSLRRAGHEVEIFEKSAFAAEIGAALVVTPNGARVLEGLDFSFEKARAVRLNAWSVFHGEYMKLLNSVDMRSAREKFGAEPWAIHRVDLHTELLRLATSSTVTGKPAKLHLSSEVVSCSTKGSIVLKDGSIHSADLVVAADGLKSVLRAAVTQDQTPPKATGMSAFRLLVDTRSLQGIEKLDEVLHKVDGAANLLADVKETAKERHMMWYSCRNGDVQNIVGIHPTRNIDGDDPEAVKALMLEEFSHFHPQVLEVVRQSSAVKCWPLFAHEPLSRWHSGRILLIGDAAHPMLPFGGQGGNAAIEDGGTLGYVLKGTKDASELPERLNWFHRARYARATRVQILSSVRAGKEKEVEQKLMKFRDSPTAPVPSNMVERTVHDFGFNAFKQCDETRVPPRPIWITPALLGLCGFWVWMLSASSA